jgi:hypothetical protein
VVPATRMRKTISLPSMALKLKIGERLRTVSYSLPKFSFVMIDLSCSGCKHSPTPRHHSEEASDDPKTCFCPVNRVTEGLSAHLSPKQQPVHRCDSATSMTRRASHDVTMRFGQRVLPKLRRCRFPELQKTELLPCLGAELSRAFFCCFSPDPNSTLQSGLIFLGIYLP